MIAAPGISRPWLALCRICSGIRRQRRTVNGDSTDYTVAIISSDSDFKRNSDAAHAQAGHKTHNTINIGSSC